MRFRVFKKYQNPLDNYIVLRYNEYIDSRYNGGRWKGAFRMGTMNPALTEAVYYILLSLMQPLHGYGIMQNVERLSCGRLRLAAGTLYGAISSMLEKGWISAIAGESDSRKKEYVITEAGKAILRAEYERLKELVDNGRAVLEGEQ